ncbi:formimidoylglutamate deiminase [Aquicoccus porphyridii]|uniref:Formimidoylglutamate deiminase n=1 Tax=Aquicoccus porphyridii TaxID=1852029 RepID=A0A5A9ZCP2_9RHOB|nr:formimidoylglutamate deiminase [Aquicoccus porphyridii]KAA0914920.1 formimidoylglutamate deiminase [Aquicoccus porphyridii]RAI52535.1 formimidoylglutamate deiminase [Rhodobacteraceae bacterium AsT-22]
MTRLTARRALLPTGWAENVAVTLATDGRIEAVETGVPGGAGLLLPAPGNLHSHAFQRAMAGLTEARGPDGRDSFWTWRRLMFRFLDRLTPDHVEAIAAQVQMEMLEAGYASLAEFHYLHHRPDGTAYDNPAEMSDRIAAAAQETGIGLTLLPVLYQTGGCDGRPLGDGQRRFGTATDDFATLMARAATALAPLPDANLGMAPHSLRAVPRDALALVPQMTDGPLHMHLAEQQAEVDEVQSAYGARPVEWALDNMALGPRWCLIHLTQMTGDETARLAPTGAVAGLCPITEANLGDGIFNATGWRAQGGAFGMGSDSNVLISLTEELRQLEYSQRLRDRARAVLAEDNRSTGRVLFEEATRGAARALGRDAGEIAPGKWADLVRLDDSTPDMAGRPGDTMLDAWIFARASGVRDLWSAGRHVVRDGRHIARETIAARYADTMHQLRDAL